MSVITKRIRTALLEARDGVDLIEGIASKNLHILFNMALSKNPDMAIVAKGMDAAGANASKATFIRALIEQFRS